MRQAFTNCQRGKHFCAPPSRSPPHLTSLSVLPPPAESGAGFDRHGGAPPVSPVLVSVPHAGRDYPAALRARARVTPAVLRRLEDRHADLLAAALAQAGHGVLIARAPRAMIDLNRDERDLDGEMIAGLPRDRRLLPGAKSRAGLGLLPRRLTGAGELWRARIGWDEVEGRIAAIHRPYHAALAAMVADTKARFGQAVLIDLHSMPPLPAGAAHGAEPARIVLGDRFGRSAGSRITAAAAALFEARGMKVAQNHPYAGNYLLDRHGAPERGIHAVQVEIDRRLYLDAALDGPGPGLAAMQAVLLELAATLAAELDPGGWLQAAE